MLRRLIRGAGRVGLWLLSGAKPVDRFLAAERAATCLACPMNMRGRRGVASALGGALAEAVGLARPPGVAALDRLGTCSGCGCNLVLKVWVPLRGGEDASRLAANCWVRRELE